MLDHNCICINCCGCELSRGALRDRGMATGIVQYHTVSAHVWVKGGITALVVVHVFLAEGLKVFKFRVFLLISFLFWLCRHDRSTLGLSLLFLRLGEVLVSLSLMELNLSMRVERNISVAMEVTVRIEFIVAVHVDVFGHWAVWVEVIMTIHVKVIVTMWVELLRARALRALRAGHLFGAWAMIHHLRAMIHHLHLIGMVHSTNDHIVVRVAIVWDERTSIIITSKLNLRWVNLIDWSVDALTVVLDDCSVGIYSSCSELSVNARRNCDVTTDIVQGEAVSAHLRTLLHLHTSSSLLLHGNLLRTERLTGSINRRELPDLFNARLKLALLDILRERVLEVD